MTVQGVHATTCAKAHDHTQACSCELAENYDVAPKVDVEIVMPPWCASVGFVDALSTVVLTIQPSPASPATIDLPGTVDEIDGLIRALQLAQQWRREVTSS